MTDVNDSADVSRVTIQPYRTAMIASIQVDLDERVLSRFQSDLMDCVCRHAAKVAVIDLSGVEIMDGVDFAGIRKIIDALSLMGTETILCGVQPGVAASLVGLEVPLDGLSMRLNLDVTLAELDAADAAADNSMKTESTDDKDATDGSGRDEIHDPE